jgi:two-component system sensor histidine kinase CreC
MRRTLEGRDFVHHYTQNLAHELKSPIAGIRGAAELLQEPEMPAEDRARFVGNIQRETERLQQIVERVMRLATLQSEGAGELTGTVEIAGVLEEIARTMEPEVNAKNLTWEVRMEPEVRVRGDRFLIYHALINLALNAVDFSPAGGRVVVVVRVEGPSGLLEVCDEGPGVPDYALPRVFERFYSLPRPHGGAKSTGLGLSFVREIAALHGGEAGLVNVPGGGTRAWLRLPGA